MWSQSPVSWAVAGSLGASRSISAACSASPRMLASARTSIAGAPSIAAAVSVTQGSADSIATASSATVADSDAALCPPSIASTATVARNVRVAMPDPSEPASSGRTWSASDASADSESFVTATTRL